MLRHDPAADSTPPGSYWVRVMGTDIDGWQVAECYRTGWWSLLGLPRFSATASYADMIREVGPRIEPPPRSAPCKWGREGGRSSAAAQR